MRCWAEAEGSLHLHPCRLPYVAVAVVLAQPHQEILHRRRVLPHLLVLWPAWVRWRQLAQC